MSVAVKPQAAIDRGKAALQTALPSAHVMGLVASIPVSCRTSLRKSTTLDNGTSADCFRR